MKKSIKSMLCAVIILALALLQLPVAVHSTAATYSGRVYYVNASIGSDLNDGLSEAAPFATLQKVNSLALDAGDTVLFARGESWTGGWLWPQGSGTASRPITISCYGDEQLELPTIISDYSTAMSTQKPSVDAAVYLANQDYVTIEKLNIINGSNNDSEKFGVRILTRGGYYTTGCIVRDCRVSGLSWSSSTQTNLTGIACFAELYYGFISSLTIQDNEIFDCKGLGISVNGAYSGCNSAGVINAQSAKNVVIRGNYLHNIGKDGILVNNSNQPLVEYNVADNTHSFATQSYHVAMWPFATYGALFQFNEAFNTKTTYDGQGFDCDYQCYNTTFQYNYSHDNAGGFMLICTEPTNWDGGVAFNVNVTVRYNISQNDRSCIFQLTCHITDTQIYNNTIYTSAGNVRNLVSVYSRDGKVYPINTQFRNNIFYVDNVSFNWGQSTGTVWENNLVYSNNASRFPQNDSGEGDSNNDRITASGNIFADPLLVGAGEGGIGIDSVDCYQLRAGSPALGAGKLIANNGGRDYFGNAVSDTAAPNIGAYNGEGIGTAPPTPVPLRGDANTDGEVNAKDLLLMRQHLADWQVTIDLTAADCDQSGEVNAKDVLLLRQYLADIITTL